MNWLYKELEMKSLDDFPEGIIGFTYKITRISDGKFYIGRKNLYSERTKLLTKKELSEYTDKKKKPVKKKVIKESDWKTYFGSNSILKADIKELGKEAFKREILHLCASKKQMTYQETRYQFLEGCLESNNCYVDCILGKFFKKDLV